MDDPNRRDLVKQKVSDEDGDEDKDFDLDMVIGHGSYGIVCSAYDEKQKKRVAIKRNNVIDNFLYCKRLLRELVILRVLDHPNIIKLHHIQRIIDAKNFNAIYLVTDLMETDLDQVIKSNQPLTNEHIQYFMYQVLLGIKYIHSAGLIHRDLKPSNVLINSNCDIKICDFGLSVSENSHMTHYVVSRWYRAPELVIGDRKYNKSIDMWSIGCIFGELLLRRTLFPGKSPFDQFMCFVRVLGSPEASSFRNGIPQFLKDQIRRKEKEINRGRPFPARPFEVVFGKKNATKEAVDLLKNLIVYDSRKRFSVEQALAHPYFADLHDPSDEPVAGFKLQFEDYESKLSNFREVKMLIYKQSLIYNRKELRERFLNHQKSENNEYEGEVEEEEDITTTRRSNNLVDEDEEEEEEEQVDNLNDLENEIMGFNDNNNNWNVMNQNQNNNMNRMYSGFNQNSFNNNNSTNNNNNNNQQNFPSGFNNNNNSFHQNQVNNNNNNDFNTRIIFEDEDEDDDNDNDQNFETTQKRRSGRNIQMDRNNKKDKMEDED